MSGDSELNLTDADKAIIKAAERDYKNAKDDAGRSAAILKGDSVRAKYITDAYLVNKQYGIEGGQGHNSILLVNSAGQGFFFTFCPSKNETGTWGSKIIRTDGQMNYTNLTPSQVNDLLSGKSNGTVNGEYLHTTDGETKGGRDDPGYSRYIKIKVDSKSGHAMFNQGKKLFNNTPAYSVAAYNCNDVSRSMLGKGSLGLRAVNFYSGSMLPNLTFDVYSKFYSATNIPKAK